MTSFNLFVSVPKGLEPLMADELRELKAENIKETKAGVRCTGNLETAYRICLWSRLASRVLLQVGEFEAKNEQELYTGVKCMEWDQHLNVDNTIAVDFNGKATFVSNTKFGALKVKDAIADYFREKTGERPSVDIKQPDIRVNVFNFGKFVTVYLDFSGSSLHQRGYREESGKAPLKENLAAAILIRAGWKEMIKEKCSLVDPMCGTGTLPIEAALMAANIAPGSRREYFGFRKWKQHDSNLWQQLIDEAAELEKKGVETAPNIVGFDADSRSIKKANACLEQFGIQKIVHFEKHDLSALRVSDKILKTKGLVISNPPYGERLGEVKNLFPLYKHLGQKIKEMFTGWKASIFTNNMELSKSVGLRPQKKYTLFNGALECKLLNFDVQPENFYKDENAFIMNQSGIIVNKNVRPESAEFVNRIKKNKKKLKSWLKKDKIECYRIYDKDIPEYAVAVDVYKDIAYIQEYAPPKTIDPKQAEIRLNDVIATLPDALGLEEDKIFVNVRKQQKGKEQYRNKTSRERTRYYEVQEYGSKFLVKFSDYIDTGLFLDHRPIRKRIGEIAKGKRFLNLFAYTGSVTIHAARGGAHFTTTVDKSKNYLDWGKKNLALNGYSQSNHHFIQSDCIKWLKTDRNRYDLIFLDPPTFSNEKKEGLIFDVQKDHVEIIALAAKLLDKGGLLIFSNNYRKFKMDFEALNHLDIKDITASTIPMDFQRNQKIHNCWEIRNK